MITFKLIRKIGKILRGGAGRKEIILGTLFGVLIGFNPGFNFSLLLTLLFALLLNANFSFVLLGAAAGKLLSLSAAALSFHLGFAVIHRMGLEELFRTLCNAPLTALMDLNVYAMVGGFSIALIAGILLGAILGGSVVRIRTKLLEADQHEIIGKAFGNRVARLLLRLAFGKSRLTLEDEIPKKAPWIRKSGVILVLSVLAVALIFQFLLLDRILQKGIESLIASRTGAEVNVASADFSMAKGELNVEGLQITDPDKPTHNMIQIDRLAADLNIGALLRRNYEIDLLAGSVLKKDVPRESPGAVYEKEKEPEAAEAEEGAPGKALDEYFDQAKAWKKYGQKAYDYLARSRENAGRRAEGRKPEASKDEALVDAEKLGYLKASADLVAERPAWLIHEVRIEQVDLGSSLSEQLFIANELSSHPELNRKPTSLALFPTDSPEPSAKIVLRFEDPTALHAIQVNLQGMAIGEAVETSESFPVDISSGLADIHAAGEFSADLLKIPFSLLLHNLKVNVEEGQEVMGMDSKTATEVFSSMEELDIEGALGGSLVSPRVAIDYEKLTANMKNALVAAGKKELANRANAEMDKAKDELKKQADEEISKVLGGEEGESVQDKAAGALKKLF